MQEKHWEKLREIQKIQDVDLRAKSAIALDQETSDLVRKFKTEAEQAAASSGAESGATATSGVGVKVVGPPQKSLWQKFVDEVNHYKSGFVLLFVDIKVRKYLNGKTVRFFLFPAENFNPDLRVIHRMVSGRSLPKSCGKF